MQLYDTLDSLHYVTYLRIARVMDILPSLALSTCLHVSDIRIRAPEIRFSHERLLEDGGRPDCLRIDPVT